MRFRPAWAERRGYFALALGVLLVDQATKVLAHGYLQGREPVTVIPGLFDLTYSRNAGGLFGYFSDWADPWRALLLTALPLAAVVLIATMLARGRDGDRPTLLGLGSILGGAVGNLIDRVVRGEVVDFLDVYAPPAMADWFSRQFGTYHWPTFNVADSSIVVGALLLLISVVMPRRERAGKGLHESSSAANDTRSG